ncbi:HAD-IA family hydrolase [Streptomyces sp. NPDC051940]|uniref:HAD family hydrolase n=1 Tax=Streptomyces sp. NPDC051940 TaxID=3155675 RepID=UPI0034499B37
MTITTERPFDAILCDLDNVIRYFDMSPILALEEAAGLAPGTTAKTAFAPDQDLPALLGRITHEQWADSVAAALTGLVPAPVARELGAAFASSPFHADEEVVALLRAARTHLRLVLVTNATLRVEEDLAALGLSDLAHEVVSSARVGIAKPDPGIYEIAVSRAGVPAQRCLFVDDRLENVEAAASLGLQTLHFRSAGELRGRLDFLL